MGKCGDDGWIDCINMAPAPERIVARIEFLRDFSKEKVRKLQTKDLQNQLNHFALQEYSCIGTNQLQQLCTSLLHMPQLLAEQV